MGTTASTRPEMTSCGDVPGAVPGADSRVAHAGILGDLWLHKWSCAGNVAPVALETARQRRHRLVMGVSDKDNLYRRRQLKPC